LSAETLFIRQTGGGWATAATLFVVLVLIRLGMNAIAAGIGSSGGGPRLL